MTGHRAVAHGITVEFDDRHAGWTASGPAPGDAWTVSMTIPSARLALGPQPAAGKVQWYWDDGPDGATTLHLHGADSTTRFVVDPQMRRIEIDGTSTVTVGGSLEILSKWILPDLARRHLGAVPLHATAVRTTTGAIIVVGESGRGKSTLTAEMCADGAELLGDEPVCVVPNGSATSVLPGVAVIRIDASSAERLMSSGDEWSWSQTVNDIAANKVTLVDGRVATTGPVPLRAIVVLDRRRATGPVLVTERLSPEVAFDELFGQRYTRPLEADRVRADFVTLAAVVSHVPVVRASLVDDLGELPGAMHRLLDEVARPDRIDRQVDEQRPV